MLTLALKASPTNPQLLTQRQPISLEFANGKHGFADMTALYPLSLMDSFMLFERAAMPHAEVKWQGYSPYVGRVEDVKVVPNGVQVKAFGYWNALYDARYSALWSKSGYADWFQLDERSDANNQPKRWTMDTNNRLYITPTKNSTLGTTTTAKVARLGYAIPHLSSRNLTAITFDYAFLAPANWQCGAQSFTATEPVNSSAWTFGATQWTLNGTGALQTGTVALTSFTGVNAYAFYFYYNAADAVYGGETGANYLTITNLRIQTTTSASVYADEIARDLVSTINTLNSSQLQNITGLIDSPALDLKDEVYEDLWPADILETLTQRGDNATPPNIWEAGVWEDRTLHLRRRGSAGRTWYVDVGEPNINRTVAGLVNSGYALYRDASGRTLRTSTATDSDSVARWSVTRRDVTSSPTTNSTQAGTQRDAMIQDRKDPIPQASLDCSVIFDASGAPWPAFFARYGDTVVMRNLPVTGGSSVDKLRRFIVAENRWKDGISKIVPEEPLPSLDVLVARQAEGIR